MIAALALDPGKTTGYCYAMIYPNKLCLYVNEEQWSLSQLYNVLHRYIWKSQNEIPLHVIYEDFSYRNAARSGLDLTPVKILGVIELFREWHEPFVGFHLQSPATGKAFWTDDKLMTEGAYRTGKPHGRDATRHMLQWASFGAGGQFVDMQSMKIELVDDQTISYGLYGR